MTIIQTLLTPENLTTTIALASALLSSGWVLNTISTMRAVRNIRKGSRVSLVAHGIHKIVELIDKKDAK